MKLTVKTSKNTYSIHDGNKRVYNSPEISAPATMLEFFALAHAILMCEKIGGEHFIFTSSKNSNQLAAPETMYSYHF